MALCKDPLRTYLNNLGYSVILLPRTGIEPMDVLGRDAGSIERLGTLEGAWTIRGQKPSSDFAFFTPGVTDNTQLADEEPIVFERMSVIR